MPVGDAPTSVHIHEDDWGMRNLYPIVALPQAAADVAQARQEGETNRSPNGHGWTAVHVIEPPSIDYANLSVQITTIAAAIEPFLPRVRNFIATATAGFSKDAINPDGVFLDNAHCYGLSRSCFIKLDTGAELVKSIWFECCTGQAAHRDALRNALIAIDRIIPSAIADYWNDMAGAIADEDFLNRYFEALAD